MRILRGATEDEVVAVFLRGELDSGRYGEVLRKLLERDGVGVDVLARPDVADPAGNRCRRGVLDEYRGLEQRIGLFGGAALSVPRAPARRARAVLGQAEDIGAWSNF